MKKKRTSFRFRNTKSGLEHTVISHGNAYAIGQIVRRKSKLDGSWYTEECVLVTHPAMYTAIQHPSTYPMWSNAMGIDPDQIPEAMAADREAGFNNIEYHPDTGDIRFPDRRTRKLYCEAWNKHDLNGGYTDPQPR